MSKLFLVLLSLLQLFLGIRFYCCTHVFFCQNCDHYLIEKNISDLRRIANLNPIFLSWTLKSYLEITCYFSIKLDDISQNFIRIDFMIYVFINFDYHLFPWQPVCYPMGRPTLPITQKSKIGQSDRITNLKYQRIMS